MFKKVEYLGFDELPELRAKAEELTRVLANAIHRWRGEVEAQWSPAPRFQAGVLELTLSLALPNGVSATFAGIFTKEDFEEPWLQRSRCRQIWGDLLGVLLDEQHKRVEQSLLEAVEA
jgi:hypothetical protein